MAAENRIRVHLDYIVRGDPFKPYSHLLLWTAFLAEEALAVLDGLCINLGRGRNHSGRVELNLYLHRIQLPVIQRERP